ncbi:MAG: hypothetical protein AAF745_02580 [Planctomycetota bacterium]
MLVIYARYVYRIATPADVTPDLDASFNFVGSVVVRRQTADSIAAAGLEDLDVDRSEGVNGQNPAACRISIDVGLDNVANRDGPVESRGRTR